VRESGGAVFAAVCHADAECVVGEWGAVCSRVRLAAIMYAWACDNDGRARVSAKRNVLKDSR